MTIRFNDVWRRRITEAIAETESPIGVNLASFSPAGDDFTDDSSVFADAVAAALNDVSRTLYVGSGTYYVPTLSLTVASPLRIVSSAGILRGAGNDLFASTVDLSVEGLEIKGFGTVHNGNSAACNYLKWINVKASECDYFMEGASLVRRLDIKGSLFSDFSAGLVVLDDGTVSQTVHFEENIADTISRYIFRCRGIGNLFFRDNEITNLTSTGYSSTEAVARCIQFGFDKGNWVEGNTFNKIAATDANADIFYWTVGDLVFGRNRIGSLSSESGDARGIMEKSTTKKHLHCADNELFINADGEYFEGSLVALSSTQSGTDATSIIVRGNIAEKMEEPLVYLFNDDAVESAKPRNALISGNTIKKHIGAVSIARIVQGAGPVIVEGNIVGSHANTLNAEPDSEQHCRAVAVVMTTDIDLETDVEVSRNSVQFDDATEGRVSSLLWLSGLNAGNSIRALARDNTLGGATHLVKTRNVVGTIDAVVMGTRLKSALTADLSGSAPNSLSVSGSYSL